MSGEVGAPPGSAPNVAASASSTACLAASGASTTYPPICASEIDTCSVASAVPLPDRMENGAAGSLTVSCSVATLAFGFCGCCASADTAPNGSWPQNGATPAVHSNAGRPTKSGPG